MAPTSDLVIDLILSDRGGEFVLTRDGAVLGEMTWRWVSDGVIDILHTGIRPALQGQGQARRLVLAGGEWARGEGVTIVPDCPYARKVLTGGPAFADVLAAL